MTAEREWVDDLPTFAVAFTHRGRRARNEDAVRHEALRGGGCLAIVCDGMGGHAGGAYASKTAIESVAERIASGMDPAEAVVLANAEIHAQAERDSSLQGMGTTLVMALVRDGRATVYNVGDSRAYLLGPSGSCDAVTRDHSFLAESIAAGEMSEAEALSSRYKNALTRAVGTEASLEVDRFGPFDLTGGASLLLCSDGFYKAVPTERIPSLVRGAAKSAADDVAAAVLAAYTGGSDDNISVLVIGQGTVGDTRVARRFRALETKLDRLSAKEARAKARAKARAAGAASGPQWGRRAVRALLAVGLLGIGLWSLYSVFLGGPTNGVPAAATAVAAPETTGAPAMASDQNRTRTESTSVRRSIAEVVGPIQDPVADSARKQAAPADKKAYETKCADPANSRKPECSP